MKFVDINTNYTDLGGGIRTYHQDKIAWFSQQREHTYYLVVPGPRFKVQKIAANFWRIEVYGVPLGGGYRLMLDYWRVADLLRRLKPDVLEAGDPLLTALFCLTLRRWWRGQSLFSSFFHSDLIGAWVVPWSRAPGPLRHLRQAIAGLAGRLFGWMQRQFDVTVVTSRVMENLLRSNGVPAITRKPLGVNPAFFAAPTLLPETPSTIKLLYAGRLGPDKGIDVLERALPRLLDLPDVELTVVGRGLHGHALSRLNCPGYRYLGYIRDRQELAKIYRDHHVLLAPGPYETFGLGILEALACGLVVVGPDAGGAGELLGELGSPWVFKAGDADDFLRAVLLAMRANFSEEARKSQTLARQYGTSDEAIGRLIDYYEQCCVCRRAHGSRAVDPADRQKLPATENRGAPAESAEAPCQA